MRDDLSFFIRGMAFTARTALRGLTRPQVEGALDRIPRSGALIVAGNHLSNADGVLIGGWLTPALGRRIHWLGKREMVEWPVLGKLVEASSIHPVDRGTADVEVEMSRRTMTSRSLFRRSHRAPARIITSTQTAASRSPIAVQPRRTLFHFSAALPRTTIGIASRTKSSATAGTGRYSKRSGLAGRSTTPRNGGGAENTIGYQHNHATAGFKL